MKVFAIACGHRSVCDSKKLEAVVKSNMKLNEFLEQLRSIATEEGISNSEIALAIASYGACTEGAEIEYLRLNELIDIKGNLEKKASDTIARILEEADGIIFGSPLHFGNPSSYLLRFLQAVAQFQEVPLSGKVIGQVIVGARRNGGQEAGNIFCLLDYAQLGACVVGDGPPFSQSGGVLESRNAEDAVQDIEGVKTCLNTGARVMRALNVLGHSNSTEKSQIAIITDSDRSHDFSHQLSEYLASSEYVRNTVIINLEKFQIERCIGCKQCPVETESFYKCIVNDKMYEIEKLVADADGLIVCLEARRNSWSSYYWQTFIERSRYLRRNNYRLANKPIMSVQYCSDAKSLPFHVRIIPPSFKHDMIFIGPCITAYPGIKLEVLDKNFSDTLNKFCSYTSNAKVGRRKFPYSTMYKEEARRFV